MHSITIATTDYQPHIKRLLKLQKKFSIESERDGNGVRDTPRKSLLKTFFSVLRFVAINFVQKTHNRQGAFGLFANIFVSSSGTFRGRSPRGRRAKGKMTIQFYMNSS